jgi:hypothetical protein
MNDQEYQDKLKVREQLSQWDRLRTLEYEVKDLQSRMRKIEESTAAVLDLPKPHQADAGFLDKAEDLSHIEELERKIIPESTAGFLD